MILFQRLRAKTIPSIVYRMLALKAMLLSASVRKQLVVSFELQSRSIASRKATRKVVRTEEVIHLFNWFYSGSKAFSDTWNFIWKIIKFKVLNN